MHISMELKIILEKHMNDIKVLLPYFAVLFNFRVLLTMSFVFLYLLPELDSVS